MDIVINYVNGNDQDWLAQRQKYSDDNTLCRFRDNNELKYSLRAIEKNAPWIDKVFILADSKMPDWLITSNNKIRIVRHEEFMPQNILPCYNSNVIEAYLYNIEELSEIFLYANDDMILGKPLKESFFCKDGKPQVRMVEKKITPVGYYNNILLRTQRLFNNSNATEYQLLPWHNIDVYSKSAMRECVQQFYDDFFQSNCNRFRSENDIQRVIFHYYMVHNNLCDLIKYNYSSMLNRAICYIKEWAFPSKYLDFCAFEIQDFFDNRRKMYRLKQGPKVFCINDSEKTTEHGLRCYKEYMELNFPQKSSFEK